MNQISRSKLERRQKILLAVAWISIFAPLSTFIYLTWKTYGLREEAQQLATALAAQRTELSQSEQQTAQAQALRATLERQNQQLDQELKEKQSNLVHYRRYAGIRIRYYRPTDAQVIERVGAALGIPTGLGQSRLINSEPSEIVYGSEVSEQDYRDIAVALIGEGFPLRSIARARDADQKLIQVVASAPAERNCGLLSVEQVRAGATCGPLQP